MRQRKQRHEEEGGEERGSEKRIEYKIPRAKHRGQKQMKEGKVIKIMRQQSRELVGVVQSVGGELALFQKLWFLFLSYVHVFFSFTGLQKCSSASASDQFLVTIKYEL